VRYCLALMICLFLLTASCGYQESIVQKSEKSYLKFTGNPTEVTIQIDDMTPFSVAASDKLYQISPGQHIVKAYRNGELIVNRVLIVDSQVTTEVTIP
jgi:hypothetical protein